MKGKIDNCSHGEVGVYEPTSVERRAKEKIEITSIVNRLSLNRGGLERKF